MTQSISITNGKYVALIRTTGGALSSLSYDGRNLVDPYDCADSRPLFKGDVLAPWPNRIRDGQYTFENTKYILAKNEASRSNALHGLLLHNEWEVINQETNTVTLFTTLEKSDAYPTDLAFEVCYTLSNDGLRWDIKAKNTGHIPGPYGVSIHPYLIADPESGVDTWSLSIPSHMYMTVDTERLLPMEVKETPENLSFQHERLIVETFIDHAFFIDKPDSNQVIILTAKSGKNVFMKYSNNMQWIQIHTADRGGAHDSRKCLAVEPMTCPPDAFNSALDLVILKPGQSHSASWWIGTSK